MFEAAQSTALQHWFCSLPEGCYGNCIVQSSLVWDNLLPARSAHVLCAEVRGTQGAGAVVLWFSVWHLALPGFFSGLQYCLPWWKWWCGKLLFSCCDSLRSLSESGYVRTHAPRVCRNRVFLPAPMQETCLYSPAFQHLPTSSSLNKDLSSNVCIKLVYTT